MRGVVAQSECFQDAVHLRILTGKILANQLRDRRNAESSHFLERTTNLACGPKLRYPAVT
jgi:hypothetical protein